MCRNETKVGREERQDKSKIMLDSSTSWHGGTCVPEIIGSAYDRRSDLLTVLDDMDYKKIKKKNSSNNQSTQNIGIELCRVFNL